MCGESTVMGTGSPSVTISGISAANMVLRRLGKEEYIWITLAGAGFFLLHRVEESRFLFYSSGMLIGLGLSVLSGSSLRYIMLNETTAVDRAVSQGKEAE